MITQSLYRGLAATLLAFGVAGCASYNAGTAPTRDVGEYKNSTDQGGVKVAADLYTDPVKTKDVFYVDLAKEGFYPVLVMVQDNGDDRLLVETQDFTITDSKGNTYKPASVTDMTDEFGHHPFVYAVIGGIFSYISAEDANKKMTADWTEKQFPAESILKPGRMKSGFLYFRMPDGVTPKGMTLEFPVESLETKKSASFRLIL
jgi:hypothetical protein